MAKSGIAICSRSSWVWTCEGRLLGREGEGYCLPVNVNMLLWETGAMLRRRYQVVLVFRAWKQYGTTAVSDSTATQCHRTISDRGRKKVLLCCLILCIIVHMMILCVILAKILSKRILNANWTSPMFLSPAVWKAAPWAMTVTRPTPAAYRACPTAPHLCPGATASPAPVSRRAKPRLPQVEDTRGARPAPSTPPTRCLLARPAASAARLALSSSKAWTTATSSPVTWATPTSWERACGTTTTTTTWPTGKRVRDSCRGDVNQFVTAGGWMPACPFSQPPCDYEKVILRFVFRRVAYNSRESSWRRRPL